MCHIDNPILKDQDKAREYPEAVRRPTGPACMHCGGSEKVRRPEGKAHRPGVFQCASCRRQFTVTVGTRRSSGMTAPSSPRSRSKAEDHHKNPASCPWRDNHSARDSVAADRSYGSLTERDARGRAVSPAPPLSRVHPSRLANPPSHSSTSDHWRQSRSGSKRAPRSHCAP